MPKPQQQWTVLPHGQLTRVNDKLMTVTGDIHMPLVDLPRRMTVVRLSGARLVVFSAIALDESEMALLESWGKPTFLVVPSDRHRLDAKVWKDRYPGMQVIAPHGARVKVEDTVKVDTVAPDFEDSDVEFMVVPGTRGHEAALLVRSDDGCTLILNDVVGNIRDASGFGGWWLRLTGFAGDEPHIPAVVKMMVVDDTQALRLQLVEWAAMASLTRIVVSHGSIIEDNPRQTLRDLAHSLD